MSRGFGRVERVIIDFLGHNLGSIGATGPELAQCVSGSADSPSVRRALIRLKAKGVIQPLPNRHDRSIVWILTLAASDEDGRKRRRERDRARQKRQSEDAQIASRRLRDQAHDTARLERLLGMLGSAHEGEILNAAQAVEKERRRLGKTWNEILSQDSTIAFFSQ